MKDFDQIQNSRARHGVAWQGRARQGAAWQDMGANAQADDEFLMKILAADKEHHKQAIREMYFQLLSDLEFGLLWHRATELLRLDRGIVIQSLAKKTGVYAHQHNPKHIEARAYRLERRGERAITRARDHRRLAAASAEGNERQAIERRAERRSLRHAWLKER